MLGGQIVLDEKRTFQDVVGDMVYGSDPPPDADDPEEEDNPTAPEEDAPEEESPSEPDKPTRDPEPEEESEEPEEAPESEETETPADEPEEAGEDAEDEDLEDVDADEPEESEEEDGVDIELPEGFEIRDGRVVAVADEDEELDLDELRKGYLRQSDYTQKTQQLAEQRKQTEQARQETRQLVRDLNADSDMREFLSEHPEAMEFMLEDPEGARRLLRDKSEFDAFVNDYEVLQENPRLAEAYLKSDDEQTARQQLQQERVKQNIMQFVNELDAGINQIAQHEEFADAIEDEDVEAVREHVMDLAGFGPDSEPEEIVQGVERLASIFLTPDGRQLDMGLVIDRFENIKARKDRESSKEDQKAEEHNKQVDAELEEQKDRPPSTPEGEGGPAAEAEKVPERKNFREVLGSLRGDD